MATMTTGKKGITLIKFFEGFRTNAYLDSVGVPTIGYGTTAGVKLGQVITQAQAETFLHADLLHFETVINKVVTVPLTQDQFDALVAFTYNLGEGNLKSSTLLRVLNQKHYEMVPDQMMRWNKAGGKVLKGLTTRRQAEGDLFSKGQLNLG